jgi:hypothetical protein
MRKLFLIFVFVQICGSANSTGLPVIDAANLVEKIKSTFYQIKEYTESIRQTYNLIQIYEKAIKQVQALDGIKDWRRLVNIYNNVVDQTNAYDRFDEIPRINVHSNWYKNVEGVLYDTHGLLSLDDYLSIYNYIQANDPGLAQSIEKDLVELVKQKQNAVNGLYFVSAKIQTKSKRIETMETQNTEMNTMGDLSLGKSANLLNTQVLLLNQQMEEVLNSLNQQIVATSSTELYQLREKEKLIELRKKISERRNNFDWDAFYRN